MRQMDVKYLAFEAIKSGCGAELTLQLVHQDGTLAAPEVAADRYLQVFARTSMLFKPNVAAHMLGANQCAF